jgi:small subunit ribosomal protein S6
MRPYEIAIIFDSSLEEGDARDVNNRVVELVRSRGGRSGRVDWWGRRQFAYELRHRTEGYYAFTEVTAEPEVMAEVDRMLALSDAVLRHRVIRQPERRSAPRRAGGGPATAASPASAPAAAPATAASPASAPAAAPAAAASPASAPAAAPAAATPPPPAAPANGGETAGPRSEPAADRAASPARGERAEQAPAG